MEEHATPPPDIPRPAQLLDAFLNDKTSTDADPMAFLLRVNEALRQAEEDVKLLGALRALEMTRLADRRTGLERIALRCGKTKGWVSQQVTRARGGEASQIIERILAEQAARAFRVADDARVPVAARTAAHRRAQYLGTVITRCVERFSKAGAAKAGAAALTLPGWREWLTAKTAALTGAGMFGGTTTTAAAAIPTVAESGIISAAVAKLAAVTGTTATVAATATTVALAAPAIPVVADAVIPNPPAIAASKSPAPATTPSSAPSSSPTSDSTPTTAGVGSNETPHSRSSGAMGPGQLTSPPAVPPTATLSVALPSPARPLPPPSPVKLAPTLAPTPVPSPSPSAVSPTPNPADPSPAAPPAAPAAQQACAAAPADTPAGQPAPTTATPTPAAPGPPCPAPPPPAPTPPLPADTPGPGTATVPPAPDPGTGDSLKNVTSLPRVTTWRPPRPVRKRSARPRQETIVSPSARRDEFTDTRGRLQSGR